nr:VOC family protein [Acidiphilium sp. C61]
MASRRGESARPRHDTRQKTRHRRSINPAHRAPTRSTASITKLSSCNHGKSDMTEMIPAVQEFHLSLRVADKQAVIESYHRARSAGAEIVKPPRTTWRGTPLHELWLRDPTGYLIEIYARLTDSELAAMPADKEPVFLVAGTET